MTDELCSPFASRRVLVFEWHGTRTEYPDMAESEVTRILRNQDSLRRRWDAPGNARDRGIPWPGDCWRLA